VADKKMVTMELGLAHFLSRYKLKLSPDRIYKMIVRDGGDADEVRISCLFIFVRPHSNH
jgi:hypothetical protein